MNGKKIVIFFRDDKAVSKKNLNKIDLHQSINELMESLSKDCKKRKCDYFRLVEGRLKSGVVRCTTSIPIAR